MQVGSDRARRSLAYLRHRISSGEWPINSKIPTETELMQLLGVGKTTVREAVRALASVGMLEPLPGIGTFVRSRVPVSSLLTDYIAEFSVGEVLGYRRALEMEAAQQAALHRTDEQLAAMRRAVSASMGPWPARRAGSSPMPASVRTGMVTCTVPRMAASVSAFRA